ncbi:hypothetical protein Tco_0465867 [Tanacetum coccineum]
MRTRSQTRNRNRQQQSQQAVVQPFHLEEPFVNPPLVPMADNRTMAQLLQAPTEGYGNRMQLIASTMRFPDIQSTQLAYGIYPFSLKGQPGFASKKNVTPAKYMSDQRSGNTTWGATSNTQRLDNQENEPLKVSFVKQSLAFL